MKRSFLSAAAAGLVLACGAASIAQTLADHVPSDAVVYIGWRGMSDPEPGFAGSHWAAIVRESQLIAFVDQTLPAVGKAVGFKNPKAGPLADASANVLRQAIRHPAAMYVSLAADGMPRMGLLCNAGADESSLRKAVELLVADMPREAKAVADSHDGIVSLSLNGALIDDAKTMLAGDPTFKAALTNVAADGSIVGYLNFDVARNVGVDALAKADPGDIDIVRKSLASAGLNDVHSAIVSASFKDRAWQTDAFLAAPSPRTGLLSLADFKPLDRDLLKRVPAGAFMAAQVPFDAEQLLAVARKIASDIYPPARDILDKAVGAVTIAVGRNLETELLPAIGKQWLGYTAPQIGGSSMMGGVLVNKLANPTKARQAIGSITAFLANTGATATKDQPFTITTRTFRSGDTTVTYVASPVISPAWAIRDGYLYVGLFPQTVAAAAQFHGEALADSDAFKTAMKNIDNPAAASVSYANLAVGFPEGYGSLLMLSRSVFGLSDMFAAPAPEPMIPPITSFTEHLTPAGSAMWSDDAGVHSRFVEPFPTASTVSNLSMSTLFFNPSMMIPALLSGMGEGLSSGRARAVEITSATNLRQLGLACMLYANEHGDSFPPDIKTILQTQDLTPVVFMNPRKGTEVPPNLSRDEAIAWASEHSDYVYVGAGMKTSTAAADMVLAYEKPEGLTDGINILFCDGHVDLVTFAEVPSTFKLHNQTPPQLPTAP